MASPLEGQIAKVVYAGFRGRLLKGVLRRTVSGASGSLDQLGDRQDTETEDHPFEGFRETYSKFTRAAAGIPETDSQLVIIAQSINIPPAKGDKLWIADAWWMIRNIPDVDPANATFTCQGYQVPGSAPAGP